VAQLYDLILHADIDAHLAGDAFAPVSAEAMSLLRAMLTRDPFGRISARRALTHPWLAGAAPEEPPAEALPRLASYEKLVSLNEQRSEQRRRANWRKFKIVARFTGHLGAVLRKIEAERASAEAARQAAAQAQVEAAVLEREAAGVQQEARALTRVLSDPQLVAEAEPESEQLPAPRSEPLPDVRMEPVAAEASTTGGPRAVLQAAAATAHASEAPSGEGGGRMGAVATTAAAEPRAEQTQAEQEREIALLRAALERAERERIAAEEQATRVAAEQEERARREAADRAAEAARRAAHGEARGDPLRTLRTL